MVEHRRLAISSPSPLQEDARRVSSAFRERFRATPRLFQAPGRINIIGEHTDYSGGLVMPAAIDRRCLVAMAPGRERALTVVSSTLKAEARLDLDALERKGGWSDYVAGIAAALLKAGIPLSGCDVWIDSAVPMGAGVSSSAALEVALACALTTIAGVALDGIEIAKLAQQAENDFVGMPCGIMDQFASANGVEDCALLLDCRSLKSEAVPLPREFSFLLVNSMVRHTHTSGKYRERRAECEAAATALGVKDLGQVPESSLPMAARNLPEGPAKRCRHVVTEIARVRAAAADLRAGDIAALGRALNASHASLRDDMEVSVELVDALVEIAQSTPGVMGARMMGGGFGGCVIALVQAAAANRCLDEIATRYAARIGEAPDALI